MVANIVRELSGDWIAEIACEDIQKQGRWYYDELVYFGKKEGFAEGGKVDFLSSVSMHDKYGYD